uniref:Uncharacterized protein n=1 Tax=Cacopsylla melanoneura TaxID=428564 RepID=A0A8D9BKP7_9HEMI
MSGTGRPSTGYCKGEGDQTGEESGERGRRRGEKENNRSEATGEAGKAEGETKNQRGENWTRITGEGESETGTGEGERNGSSRASSGAERRQVGQCGRVAEENPDQTGRERQTTRNEHRADQKESECHGETVRLRCTRVCTLCNAQTMLAVYHYYQV